MKRKLFFLAFALAGTAIAQAPVANFNASQTQICQGSTVNFFDLSTNSPTSWSWTFQGGTPGTSTSQNPSVTYATPGVYDVTLTATNGFGSGTLTQTAYITVVIPPGPSNAGPDQQICDDSTSFAANTPSPGTGQWYVIFGGGVVTTPNSPTSPVTGLSPGINIFEWRVSNDPCTANRDTVRILVDLPPTPADAGPDQNICSPTNFTTLAGNTPFVGTGLWTLFSGNGVIGTPTSPNAPVTSLGLGTNVFVWTTSNGVCPSSSDSVNITVLNQPVIGVNPPSVAICDGQSFVISGTGGVSYTWAPASGLSATTGTSVSASPTATTTYTVTGTDINGCTNTGTCVITVNPYPTITLSMANDTTCSNSPMNITASGATSYTWSPATGLSATVGSSVNCLPTSTSTYTVIGNTSGCQDTATFTMATIPAPTAVVIPASAIICQGNSVNLTGSGGTSYNWFPSTGLSATTGTTVVATPSSTTQYNVIAIAANGCVDTAQTLILVNPPPNVSVSPSNPNLCTGDTLTLTASGAVNYQWTPATFISSTTSAVVQVWPSSTTTYTVVGTASGCPSNSTTVTVTVNTTPTITVSPGGASLCFGSQTNFTASGGTSYTWAPAAGLSSTTGAVVSANPSVTTTYTLTGQNANGCIDTAVFTVIINPLFLVSTSGTPAFCGVTNSGTATATPGGGTPPFTYQWTDPFNQTTQTAQALPPGTYFVTVTDSNGCSNTQSVTITSVSDMSMTLAYNNPTCANNANGTGMVTVSGGAQPYSYTWSTTPAQTTATATGLGAGGYTVTVTDTMGCTKTIAFGLTSPSPMTFQHDSDHAQCQDADGAVAIMNLSGGTPPYAYLWNTGGTNSNLLNLLPGTYSVVITDFNGCQDSTSISINDITTAACIHIPNVFSPNGDGQHDTWFIENLDYYTDVGVEIYNRWGVLVFKDDAYVNNWDGRTADGKSLPGGSYYFVLKLTTTGDPVKGILSILR